MGAGAALALALPSPHTPCNPSPPHTHPKPAPGRPSRESARTPPSCSSRGGSPLGWGLVPASSCRSTRPCPQLFPPARPARLGSGQRWGGPASEGRGCSAGRQAAGLHPRPLPHFACTPPTTRPPPLAPLTRPSVRSLSTLEIVSRPFLEVVLKFACEGREGGRGGGGKAGGTTLPSDSSRLLLRTWNWKSTGPRCGPSRWQRPCTRRGGSGRWGRAYLVALARLPAPAPPLAPKTGSSWQ